MATLGELGKAIEEAAGVDPGDLPQTARVRWFGEGLWEVGKSIPGQPSLICLAIFQTDLEYRVYAVPTAEGAPPTRYRLHKSAPVMSAESMPLDTFKNEVAAELMDLAEESGDFDDEAEEAPVTGIAAPAVETS